MLRRLNDLVLTERTATFRVVFVVAAFVISFATRYLLDPSLPPGFPYLTFFPAVILTAFFAGVRAGIVQGVICGLASWYFFVAPLNSFTLTWFTGLALGFYALIVATDVFLIHVMAVALETLKAERAKTRDLALSRELMFNELQHRVSNHLQIVSSLLTLQRREVADPCAKLALEAAATRLSVIAKIQRRLHDPDHQELDLRSFLQEIVPDLISAAALEDRVNWTIQADPLFVSSEEAVPVALIVTELIANSLEHGLRDEGLDLKIALQREGRMASLEVSDNGRGLPEGFDLSKTRSLGLQIARQFTLQMEGTLTLETTDRTRARVVFPVSQPDPTPPALRAFGRRILPERRAA